MSEPGCLYYKTEAGDVVPVARLPKVIVQPPSPASGWVRMSSPEGNSQAPGWGWGNGVPFVFQSTDASQAEAWFTTNANQTVTILEDGVYDLSVYFRWWVTVAWPSPASPAGVRAGVYLNGNHVPVFQTGDTWSGSGPTDIATSHMMALAAGDVIGAVFEFNMPAGNFGEVPTGGFFQVTRIPMEGIKGERGEPGSDENPAEWARAGMVADFPIPAGGPHNVPWGQTETSSVDDFAWEAGGVCRIKKAGVYLVTVDASLLQLAASANTDNAQIGLLLGSQGSWVAEAVETPLALWTEAYASAVIDVAANDTVRVQAATNATNPPVIASTSSGHRSQFTIVRLSGQKGDKGDPGDVSLAQLNALPKGMQRKVEVGSVVVPIGDPGNAGASTELARLTAVTFSAGRLYRVALRIRACSHASVAAGGANAVLAVNDGGAWAAVDAWISLTGGLSGFSGAGTYEGFFPGDGSTRNVIGRINPTIAATVFGVILYVEDVGPALPA